MKIRAKQTWLNLKNVWLDWACGCLFGFGDSQSVIYSVCLQSLIHKLISWRRSIIWYFNKMSFETVRNEILWDVPGKRGSIYCTMKMWLEADLYCYFCIAIFEVTFYCTVERNDRKWRRDGKLNEEKATKWTWSTFYLTKHPPHTNGVLVQTHKFQWYLICSFNGNKRQSLGSESIKCVHSCKYINQLSEEKKEKMMVLHKSLCLNICPHVSM